MPVSNDYALVASTEDSLIMCNAHIVWYTAGDKHISFYLDLRDKIHRQQKELIIGSIMYNIHILHIFQTVIRNTSAVKALSLNLQAIFLTGCPCSFWKGKKKGKQKAFCIISSLCDRVIGLSGLLAAIWEWDSSTLQAVCWESRLLWELCLLQDTTAPGGFYTL